MTRRQARQALTGQAAAVRALAGRWLDPVADDTAVREAGGDFACAPAGLWLALSAVAAGARGETATELRELLGVSGPEAATAGTELARALADTDALRAATGVWTRVPVYRAFRAALPEIGFGRLNPRDTTEIDAWLRQATGGLVERLPVVPSPNTPLLLVTTLLLTARWADPFDAGLTGERPFTDARGGRHTVRTMWKTVPATDAWQVPEYGASVVELRCVAKTGGLPALARFVLGSPGAPAGRVLPAAWAPVAKRTPIDADEVAVSLPRHTLRSRLEVLPHLAALGVRVASERDADLSRISPERMKIGQVTQECLIQVAEKGVEAAAATTVRMTPAAFRRPPRVRHIDFDRPFGVTVLDGGGSVPLFAAWQASVPRDVTG